MSFLLTGLLGGWLTADATALAQILVSQPLVGGTLTGLLWGDPVTGMRVGALLQLFALARLPLGGRTPDDFATGGVVGASSAVLLHRVAPYAPPAAPFVLGIVGGLAVAIAGRPLIGWLRHRNEKLTRWSEAQVEAGRAGALDLAHWLGVAHAFAVGVGLSLGGVAAVVMIGRWALIYDSVAVGRAAALGEPLLWGVGAGLAARQFVSFRRGTGAMFVAALAILLALRLAALP